MVIVSIGDDNHIKTKFMLVYIEVLDVNQFLLTTRLLSSMAIFGSYSIGHMEKYNTIRYNIENYILYDDELYCIDPKTITGGNMYYNTFFVYDRIYKDTDKKYKVISTVLFTCEYYLNKLETQLKLKS